MAKIRLHEHPSFGADCRLTECDKITNKKQKLLFFRSPVAIHLSISTKLCTEIEDVM